MERVSQANISAITAKRPSTTLLVLGQQLQKMNKKEA
jgi:hypothetical protein